MRERGRNLEINILILNTSYNSSPFLLSFVFVDVFSALLAICSLLLVERFLCNCFLFVVDLSTVLLSFYLIVLVYGYPGYGRSSEQLHFLHSLSFDSG